MTDPARSTPEKLTDAQLADGLDRLAREFEGSVTTACLTEAASRLREPLEMFLCEANNVVLKPQAYRFVVDPNCEQCKKAEIDATDFGVPPVNTSYQPTDD